MSHGPKPLIAGNWKMNGLRANLLEISQMGEHFTPDLRSKADLMICPPFPLLGAAVEQAGAGCLLTFFLLVLCGSAAPL